MQDKISSHNFLLQDLDVIAANILKQDALSVGADLATPKDTIVHAKKKVDCLLMCTKAQLKKIIKKEKKQGFGLEKIAQNLQAYLGLQEPDPKIMATIECGEKILQKAEQAIKDGASMIAVRHNGDNHALKTSIDLLYAQSMQDNIVLCIEENPSLAYALDRGFTFVCAKDYENYKLASAYEATFCVTHRFILSSSDIINELHAYLNASIAQAKSFHVQNLVLDLGFSYEKSMEQKIKILQHVQDFASLGYEILLDVSDPICHELWMDLVLQSSCFNPHIIKTSTPYQQLQLLDMQKNIC